MDERSFYLSIYLLFIIVAPYFNPKQNPYLYSVKKCKITWNKKHMDITENKRFNFINSVVLWEGQINASHIAEKFQLTRQAASTVLKQYRDQNPNNLQYYASSKAFLATEHFNQKITANQNAPFSQYVSEVNVNSTQKSLTQDCIFEVEAPLRNIKPLNVRPILRAIRENLAIDIGYISLSSPEYLDRIIEPHALIFDGLRWHVRAYCRKNEAFRDFTLSRFNGSAEYEGKAEFTRENDTAWNTIVNVIIEPDPRFNTQQKRIIEQDFQMEDGCKTIATRAALVNYLLRRLHINIFQNTPEEQQIVLTQASRKAITQYLPQPR